MKSAIKILSLVLIVAAISFHPTLTEAQEMPMKKAMRKKEA